MPRKSKIDNLRYNLGMRRLLACSLLLFFSLPLITPLLASNRDADANLPACCRRNGAHHCAMNMALALAAARLKGSNFSVAPSKCPFFPKAVSPIQHHDQTFDTTALLFGEVVAHPAMRMQTEARARVALDRSRRKRGPPAVHLS